MGGLIPGSEGLLLLRQSSGRFPFLCDCIFRFGGRTSRTRRGGGPVLLMGILDGCGGLLQPGAVICGDGGDSRRSGIREPGIRRVVFEMRESGLDSIRATRG